jgi:hypothetical protein
MVTHCRALPDTRENNKRSYSGFLNNQQLNKFETTRFHEKEGMLHKSSRNIRLFD